jgi:hypothetical protein
MNLNGRTFRELRTGEDVKIIDSFGNIAISEGGKKVKVDDLINESLYEEQINVEKFLDTSNAFSNIVEQIKQVPTDGLIDESVSNDVVSKFGNDDNFRPSTDDIAIIQVSEEDERAELMRKYNIEQQDTTSVENQQKAFDSLLNPEQPTRENNDVVRVEADRGIKKNTQPQPQVQDDPIITMFKRTKRSVDLNIDLNIDNKIPRLDFIEMMEDSYETSIIEFLSNDITDKILSNPQLIKGKIESEIRKMVYGEIKSKPKTNRKVRKVTKLSAKERSEKVSEFDNIEKIKDFLKNEKAKTVLKAGNERIKQLGKNKQES